MLEEIYFTVGTLKNCINEELEDYNSEKIDVLFKLVHKNEIIMSEYAENYIDQFKDFYDQKVFSVEYYSDTTVFNI